MLAKASGTDYDTEWVDAPSGGGGGVYALWKARGDVEGTSFANTEVAIPWDPFEINPNSDVTVSGSQITIGTTGTYKFTVTLGTDSNNRTELIIRYYLDTGSGLAVGNEYASDYVARDADQDTGGVDFTSAFALTAGDVIEFRGEGDCDGSCVGRDAATRLLIERVA